MATLKKTEHCELYIKKNLSRNLKSLGVKGYR